MELGREIPSKISKGTGDSTEEKLVDGGARRWHEHLEEGPVTTKVPHP